MVASHKIGKIVHQLLLIFTNKMRHITLAIHLALAAYEITLENGSQSERSTALGYTYA